MILDAKRRGIPFGWIGMDSFYGQQSWFLAEFEKERIVYIADIPCDTRVWLNKPDVGIPQKNGIRGRNPTIEKVLGKDNNPIRVDKLANQLDSSQWHRVYLRDSERKEMWYKLAYLRVFPVKDKLPGEECWLIIRRNEGETKYQFSNTPTDTSINRIGKMSCSRYWIERAIEDAKGRFSRL